MSRHYENILVDWSAEQEDAAALVDNGQYIDYPFAEEVGTGRGLMLHTSDDISVFCGEHAYNASSVGEYYQFGKVDGQFFSDVLIVSTSWGGYSKNIERDLDTVSCFNSVQTMFKHASSFSFDIEHQAVEHLKVTTTSIPIASVCKLIGEENTQFLLDALDISRSPSVSVVAIPQTINNILNTAIAPHITGTMKHLFAQAKITQYLSELVSCFQLRLPQGSPENLNAQKEKSIARDAYELILSKQSNIPSIVELAQTIGVSTRKLNQSFKSEFNLTPHQFIVKQRLAFAHKMLLETDISQKQLAYQLGYSHVNHFITAFKRHFGYPPGNLQQLQ